MHLFKLAVTWKTLAVVAVIGAITGCAIGNPEATRFVVKMLFELLFWCLLYGFAVKAFFFVVEQIFGPPPK
jgi:hypothetical protein